VDLQSDPEFQDLDVAFVSIAFDTAEQQAEVISEYEISNVPMLVDTDHSVSEAYDVLKWAVLSAILSSHKSFILRLEQTDIIEIFSILNNKIKLRLM